MRRMLLLALIASGLALPAAAIDLTGTWQGRQICRTSTYFDGLENNFTLFLELEITQILDIVYMRTGGADDYQGIGVSIPGRPERGFLYQVRCTTDDAPGDNDPGWDETGDFRVKTKLNGAASLRGQSIFIDDEQFGVCTWKYKRVSTADPGVGACEPIF